MYRAVTTFALVVFSLSACATIPARNPAAEVKFSEANEAMESLTDETRVFYTDIGDVLEGIASLYANPGWPELEEIIRADLSQDTQGGGTSADSRMTEALEQWSSKWGVSGESTYSEYLRLAQRCSALELHRLRLRVKLMAIQAKVISAIAMELNVGRQAHAESMEKTLETLNSYEDELNSYALNEIDLYEIAMRK